MNKRLAFGSAVAQSSLGTAVAVTPATHYVQFSEFDTEHNQLMDKVPVLSALFTSEPQVVGNLNATCKGKIPLVSAGVETVPQCDLILKAGGFTATVDATPVSGSKYIYTRSLNQVDLSMCKYVFQGTSARIYSINSVMMTMLKIMLESGKVPMLEFTGQGLAGGASAVAYESTGVVTKPTQTKIPYYAANDLASTMLDTTWPLVKADIELTNKIVHKPVMTGYGFGAPEMTDQESKVNFSILSATDLSDQPLARIRESITPGTISLTFGSVAGQRVSITTTKGQLISTKDSSQGDLLSHDLTAEYIDNEIVITFNSDLT
jgi:hypothetical protein